MINEIIHHLHFLRPQWFYAFIPLLLYLIWMIKKHGQNINWQKVCDAKLLPFMLTDKQGKRSFLPVWLTFIATSLCITALAGPVYKKLPQQVFRQQSALVILLDLSQSMNATDIKPSRIERAKLELLDILKQRHGGQTALIVYAANAFTVTPLTDDNGNIANLVPVLVTSMMPAQGSNLSDALAKAHNLFVQAGVTQGDVLVITDGIHKRDLSAIKKISAQGYRVSIFGIGTEAGSPIPLANGFLQDANGAIVIPKLNPARLRIMALAGGGVYTSIAADNSDTLKLTALFAQHANNAINNERLVTNIHADSWQDEGIWLILPLLFFAALWARKGWLALFIIFILPFPQSGFAAEKTTQVPATTITHFLPSSFSLKNLWLTPNQKAMRAFNAGNTNKAAKIFSNRQWKASALYRNGNYAQATKLFDQTLIRSKQANDKTPTASSNDYYNAGNALAKTGKYKASIHAYNEAIKLNKANKDAVYNRKLVKKALKKQQRKNKKNKSGKKQNKQNKQSKQSKQNKNNKNQQQNPTKQGQKAPPHQQKKQNSQQKQQSSKTGQQQGKKHKQSAKKFQQASKQQTAQQKKQQQQDAALKQAEAKQKGKPQKKQTPQTKAENPRQAPLTEDQRATEQWLRRIPDDPGGLLRRKFLYQYSQLPNQHNSIQPW